jgi:hypothetical protein
MAIEALEKQPNAEDMKCKYVAVNCGRDCKDCWKFDLIKPRWIPCSERLPEKNGEYLVLYVEALSGKHGQRVMYWDSEKQEWTPKNYAPSIIWKAWMPLPEPYKESED